MPEIPDSIRKQTLLQASRERVWQALSEPRQFGAWFGAEFREETFVPGRRITARMVPTRADAEVARSQQPYAGIEFVMAVERVEPLRVLAFRWLPYELEPGGDDLDAPMTLVTFELEEVPGGTLLTVTESGFNKVPLEKRAQAFTSNEQGWTIQCRLIEQYLAAGEA